MSFLETANLIDFGNEDVKGEALQKSIPSNTMISKMCTPTLVPQGTEAYFCCLNNTTFEQRRESLDNNPFDSVQKLANRPDDPFEIVEKEANQKALYVRTPVEVKLGNLLSLSDDNLIDENSERYDCEKYASCRVNHSDSSKNAGNYDCSTAVSSIYNTANSCHILDSESPPVALSQKWTPDSGNSTDSGSASSIEVGNSGKSKKSIENRKRLLKLSISNSTFNSPVSRRTILPSEGFAENSGNLSMILAEAAQLGEHFIAAESPLKLVDDDLMSEEPNWIDSEKDFDDDLEMLKIPMLQQLPSPAVDGHPDVTSKLDTKKCNETNKESVSLIGLAAIRAKLKTKRELSNNNHDISLLIDSLKSLIADINEGDDNKKQQAATLLDTLSSALGSGGDRNPFEQSIEKKEVATLAPPPIVRQGTFDMELQEKGQLEKSNNASSNLSSQLTNSIISENNTVQTTQKCEEIPDAMIRSSATYDGETAEDKQDLILPEILPSSPQPMHQPFDVNDIVEQLGKLLEQHHLNNMHLVEPGNDGAAQTSNINPTFIVVMNTSQAPLTTAQQRNSFVANCFEHSINEDSPNFEAHSSNLMRRRSQSLSIHDKVKVVQLPLMPVPAVTPDSVACDSDVNVSPASTPPLDVEAPEFKTPSRMMARRYSFSSGTPYTPVHSNFGSAAAQRRASGISETPSQIQTRRSSVLSTHHERQSNTSVSSTTTSTATVVRPMPPLNLNSLKPDIANKKKLKSSTPSDSIFKSSVPLKATIPLKKVAPMIKTSPPTPERVASKTKIASSSNNTSMQLLTKSGKLTYTSTPMPPTRSASTLDLAAGYPNACSTPTVRTSPMKRSAMNASRRYSYLAATPCAKQTASSSTSAAAAAGLRRRTLSELKGKSPVKSRISNIGGTSSNTTASSGKSNAPTRTRTPLNLPKTANKLAPTSMGRTNSRSSARTSIVSTTATHRNKENKHP